MAFIVDDSPSPTPHAAMAIASFDDIASRPAVLAQIWEASGASRAKGDPGFYSGWGKRLFDLSFGSLMLLAAGPVILALLLVVSLDGGKPIFAHTRIGRFGRPFKCLKIRSMRHDAEEHLKTILAADPAAAAEWATDAKLTNDPRVTRLGAFLRKSSLDELPQIWNVLKGEMSLVGPRPVIAEELTRYGSDVVSYMAMKPGLTGPWQVDGRNDISYDGRVALDVDYARNHGFGRDLGIVFRTGLAVLKLTGK